MSSPNKHLDQVKFLYIFLIEVQIGRITLQSCLAVSTKTTPSFHSTQKWHNLLFTQKYMYKNIMEAVFLIAQS